MDGAKSLAGLCTVCYAEKPKYLCPRCKSQTCSLPCYKRHQQRASCNGQRNPATFVKKSDWATASGIDHDYNYLKSVERSIEKAETNVRPSGYEEHGSSRRNREQWRPDSALQQYLRKHSITVQRAPEGMHRSVVNKTRITQKGKIFWTLEFIDDTGNKFVDDQCSDVAKLIDIYATAVSKSRRKPRQWVTTVASAEPTKRRKLDEATNMHALQQLPERKPDAASGDASDEQILSADDSATYDQSLSIHFYLTLPNVRSKRLILTHLNAQHTITEFLRGRTVQEFPTVYALKMPPAQLPDTFVLENTFLADLKEGCQDESSSLRSTKDTMTSRVEPAIQAEKMLELLRRDLT